MTMTAHNEPVLEVRGLCKRYAGFALRGVSFALRPGRITGFVGRNGAGKTTTLKCLLDLAVPSAGEVRFFGRPFAQDELAAKQRLGFVLGGFGYYPQKKLAAITAVTRRFYANWDDAVYRRYLARFALPEDKTPKQLSDGMRVKYALALALSHHAELLILDEPTSGLDPVSRDELLGIFLELCRSEGVTILFSTHITSDLERCADDILYLRRGELVEQGTLAEFADRYRLVRFAGAQPPADCADRLIGCRPEREGCAALVRADRLPLPGGEVRAATLEELMIFLEREGGAADDEKSVL